MCAFWKSVLRSWWRSCPCKNKCTVVHSYLWEISGHLYERRGSTHRGQRSNGLQTLSLYRARPEDSRALHLFFLFCSELSFFLSPVHSISLLVSTMCHSCIGIKKGVRKRERGKVVWKEGELCSTKRRERKPKRND